jgi:hypothetical protein
MIDFRKIKDAKINGNLFGLPMDIYEAKDVDKFLLEAANYMANQAVQIKVMSKELEEFKNKAADKVNITEGRNCYNVGTYIPHDIGRDYDGYENIQKIWADSEKEAVEKYDIKNKCDYYYGKSLGRVGGWKAYLRK